MGGSRVSLGNLPIKCFVDSRVLSSQGLLGVLNERPYEIIIVMLVKKIFGLGLHSIKDTFKVYQLVTPMICCPWGESKGNFNGLGF